MSNIRISELEEKIDKELLSGKSSWAQTYKKYNLSQAILSKWRYTYLENGIE